MKIKEWFKNFFPKKQKDSKIDVKVEKVPIWKTFVIFKGIKLPWLMIIASFVMAIAEAILRFNLIEFTANVIDASGTLPTKKLTEYALSGGGVALLMIGCSLLQGLFTNKINHNIRIKLWDKVLKLRQADLGADGGENLVSRITADTGFASAYFTKVTGLVKSLLGVTIYVVGMYQLNVTMSNYVMIFVPLSVVLAYLISWLKYRVTLKKQGFVALSTAYLVERTKDLALVKTCNTQRQEIEVGNEYFDRQYANQLQIGCIGFLSSIIDKIYNLLSTIIPYAVGAVLLANGAISLGVIIVFSQLIGDIRTGLIDSITNVTAINEANGASARITRILGYKEEDLNDGSVAPEGVEDLSFENVSFGYGEGDTIINNLSFVVPKNKVTAIVGKNGSGKTTSFKLIERLYEPNEGSISFGGQSIADYTLNSWRDKICLVAQGGALMTGTLRSNICYGRNDVTQEEFDNAVKLAHVSDFAESLPLKYDSFVAVDGTNYSGGQRQCIAIARAMLSKKPYLLLDEATSNLDAKRENDVMSALENLIKNRTTIIIAHSLRTIKQANYVVVLNNGKVESTGTPATIMKETDSYLVKMMNRAKA